MRRVAAVLILVLTAAALIAADDPPRFFIERIDVRNTRHASPAIIRAETRLTESREYTEAQLREASYRVARLPFVLDAQYSLEKGSRRDAYVFVITVKEIKPLFFEADLMRTDSNAGHGETTGGLAVGGRWFVGSRGVFYTAINGTNIRGGFGPDSNTAKLQAGYTQYDLFGTRAYIDVALNNSLAHDNSENAPALSILLGVPLTGNQTLSVATGVASASYGYGTRPNGERHSFSSLDSFGRAQWSYNTTDSPFFPTRGEIVTASVQETFGRSTGSYYFDPVNGYVETTQHSRGTLLIGSAEKHWELSERDSVSGASQIELSRSSFNIEPGLKTNSRTNTEQVVLGYSHSLFDARTTRAAGDSRIDVFAGVLRGRNNYDARPSISRYHSTFVSPALWATWSRRTAWGLVRIGAGYSW